MLLIGLAVVLAFSLTLAPLAVEAPQAGKVPQIGYLAVLPRSGLFQQNRQAFLEGMREHGYTEGQTIAIEWRFAEGRPERLSDLADELVRLKVNLIVAEATAASRAAKQATRTIPVVFIGAVDPVTDGLVISLARPGGNVTGLSSMSPELMGKRLQLLKEVVPGMTRVAVLWQPDHYGEGAVKIMSEETEAAARALAVRLQRVEARSADDLAGAFGAMTEGRADALLVWTSAMFLSERKRIVAFAARSRLPAMYPWRQAVDAGGLIGYGPSPPDVFRRAATYVDKILKGAKPGDLPVEQPSKFELVVNVKTAKALGLTIPQPLLLRADQVIE